MPDRFLEIPVFLGDNFIMPHPVHDLWPPDWQLLTNHVRRWNNQVSERTCDYIVQRWHCCNVMLAGGTDVVDRWTALWDGWCDLGIWRCHATEAQFDRLPASNLFYHYICIYTEHNEHRSHCDITSVSCVCTAVSTQELSEFLTYYMYEAIASSVFIRQSTLLFQ